MKNIHVAGLTVTVVVRTGCALAFLVVALCPPIHAEGVRIHSIKVEADEHTSVKDILSRMATKEGNVFSERTLDGDIRRLYETGYLCTGIDRKEGPDGLSLTIHITTEALITGIFFEGNHRMKEKNLKQDMDLRTGYPAHVFRIRKEEQRILSMYRKKGYHFACVNTELQAEDGGVELTFMLREGPVVKISGVSFTGNEGISDGRLAKIVTSRKHWWLRPALYVQEKVAADAENLARYYRSRGWLDARAEVSTRFARNNAVAILEFTVSEGEQYSTGEVSVSGNDLFKNEQILPKILLEEGQPFDVTKLAESIRKIKDLYASQGYMMTSVSSRQRAREDEPVMDVGFTIREGSKVYIERIDISGNEKTRDEVIRRELLFLPGELFNSKKIRRSRRAVMRTGIFERVNVNYGPGSSPELADVDVSVVEKKTGQLMFGAGYSSYDKVIGFINLSQKNFDYRRWPKSMNDVLEGKAFVGDGQLLKLNFRSGSEYAEYGFDFREPWIFNRPISFGFGLSATQLRWSQYTVDRDGGYVSLGRKIGDASRIGLRYRSERADMYDVDAAILPAVGDELGKNSLSGLALSGTMDGRDSDVYPTHGILLNVNHELVGGSLGGDLNFWKTGLRCTWYNKLFETSGGKKHVLKISTDAGWAEETSGTSNVPIYERYFAGGIRSVRGYERRSLGPTLGGEEIGGNFRLLISVEYVVPVYEDIVHGIVFYDAGEVWEDAGEFEFGELRRGVGLGFRLKTPIFPVEFYYGWGLDALPNQDEGRFHFAFGYMY